VGYLLFRPLHCNQWIRQVKVSFESYLFAVYLDDVSKQLGTSRAGCTVGNTVLNHLLLADVVFNSLWTHVVIFLLSMKLLLIVTNNVWPLKQLFPWILNGIWVKFAKQVKYLGALLYIPLNSDNDNQTQVK